MKTIKSILAMACLLMCLTNCSNDDEVLSSIQNKLTKTEELDSDTFTVHAIYKGADYRTMAVSKGSNIFYQNQEFINLMDKISSIPSSVSFIQSDSVIEYFDSQEDFLAKYGIRELTETEKTRCINAERLNAKITLPSTTRGITDKYEAAAGQMELDDLAYCGVYDDTYYSDTHIFMHIKDAFKVHDYQYLKDNDLNDKISSIMIIYNMKDPELCAILTVWEDSYYNKGDHNREKHRANFIATLKHPTNGIGSLKKVSCFNSSDSWNDRISSLSFHLGYADNLPKEY